MKEQFVPYDIANTLIDKGFNENCLGYYESSDNKLICREVSFYELEKYNLGILAPLWQQVIDWLEKKLDAAIWIEWDYETFLWTWNIIHREGKWSNMDNTIMGWELKYEARQSAIEYALTLI